MKKYLAEGIVIFASIFASFSVENFRQSSIEKEELNDAVITLGDEIISNIDFTKEHLKQVKNMLYLTEQVVNEFNTITLKEALLGFTKTITHMDEHTVEISRKRITKPFFVKTIKGEGMPIHQFPSEFGDLHVKFIVEMPKQLNDAQKKFVEENF